MVARRHYQPERGHFVVLNFTPQSGTEQGGRRPALVLSPVEHNIATGLALVCPITNQVKGSAFEVPTGARDVTGVVLANQVRAVDWLARGAEFRGVAPEQTLFEVLARIEAVLGLGR